MIKEGPYLNQIKMESDKGLKQMAGREFLFFGSVNNKFKLDNTIFHALRDPDDGYRSHLGIIAVDSDDSSKKLFSKKPLAKVMFKHINGTVDIPYFYELKGVARTDIETCDNFSGYQLIDSDGHAWLTVGTNREDGYYPCFTYSYCPNPKIKEYQSVPEGYVFFEDEYPELLVALSTWYTAGDDIAFHY